MKQAFNRSLKNNYSWLPIGTTSSIININAKGRWSIIAAIGSDGEFIVQIVNSTVNSNYFQEFIWIMNYAFDITMKKQLENICLIMDNATIHTWENTKILLSNLKLNVRYLPPYSPKLAPVELFFNIIKQKIRANYSEEQIDFDKKSGQDCIYRSTNAVSKSNVKSLWIAFAKQAKLWILENYKE